MSYYPLSQIQTNLYTDGTEFTTLDGVAYTGYYFKTSTGKLFTGKTPQDLPNQELIVSALNSTLSLDLPNESPFLVGSAFPEGDPDPGIPEEYKESVSIYNDYLLIKEKAKFQTIPVNIS